MRYTPRHLNIHLTQLVYIILNYFTYNRLIMWKIKCTVHFQIIAGHTVTQDLR